MEAPPPCATVDPDLALVTAALGGDRDCFGELVARHQTRVTGHLRRLLGNDQDAFDLGQETFIRAWSRLELYQPQYRFVSWLLVIATRLALNHRRHARLALPTLEDCDQIARSGPLPQEVAADQESAQMLVARLERIVATMPPDARVLYELRFRQELDLPELSVHFGVSEGAIKVRVHRLRQALKSALEGIHGPQ